MRRSAFLILLPLVLAACGEDTPPLSDPVPAAPETAIAAVAPDQAPMPVPEPDPAAAAAAPAVPQSRADLNFSYAPVVAEAAPAVVNVFSRRVVAQPVSPFFRDPVFGELFGRGPARERVQQSLGSGVIVDASGIVVTNHHVVADARDVVVVLADRREREASVLLADERTDLAILRIGAEGETFPALSFRDSDTLQVGDIVLAIGNPFGVGQTVTSGIVSALARTQVGVTDYQFFVQTDAAINPGNSGGALITLDGRLVGINTAIFSRTGGSIGIGFAIPSNMVRVVVDAARAGGTIARPWFGADTQPVTAEIAESLGLDRPEGVLIARVAAGSPAEQAGLQTGDIVLAVDGFAVFDVQALRYRLATTGIGRTASLSVLRRGGRVIVPLSLTALPETDPGDIIAIEGRNPFAGARAGRLGPALADELGLPEDTSGIVIVDIARGSPSARLGLRPGDLIVEVNGRPIGTLDDLRDALAERPRRWQLAIGRGGEVFTVTLRG